MGSVAQSAEIATAALAHVVSKIVPERFYSYLAAFMPGLFFVISVFFGNPVLVCEWLNRTFPLGRSTLITIALFLAFIIGNGFMLIPTLLQYFLFKPAYKVWWMLWRQFCVWLLWPVVRWLLSKPPFVRIPEARDLQEYVLDIGFSIRPEEAQRLWSCWLTVAARLLTVRYGIKSEDLHQDQWGVLYSILGRWEPEDVRGSLLVIALEATGWAGLAATRLAPALRTKYYLYFIAFLILVGLLHDFHVAFRNVDPRASGYTNVRAVLRELRQVPQHNSEDKNPVAGADETID